LALVAIGVGLWRNHLHSRTQRVIAVLLVSLILSAGGAMDVRQLLQREALHLLFFGLSVVGIGYFLRRNLLAYLAMFTVMSVLPDAVYYWRQQPLLLHWSAVIAPVTALVLLSITIALCSSVAGRPSRNAMQ